MITLSECGRVTMPGVFCTVCGFRLNGMVTRHS
jgi:hypothetical protein